MTGAELIAAERARQLAAEGWTPEHDAEHVGGEMVKAAQCYSQVSLLMNLGASVYRAAASARYGRWPWSMKWWKPSPDPIRNLVKAGALIAAEIDRLQRTEGAVHGGG